MDVSEQRVRAAIASLTGPDGSPVMAEQDVSGVIIEHDWIAVLLSDQAVPVERLARLHSHLGRVFPGFEIELRAGGRVYRGGAGLGRRRHVVAVLGGKGGVGKSTVSVNLALTLSALVLRVGLLDGDLNGPDIPHMLGIHPRERPRRDWRISEIRGPGHRRQPYERLGLEVMSVGFVVSEHAPLAATGR